MASMAKWGPKTWDVSPKKIITLEGLSFAYSQTADSTSSSDDEKEKKTTERPMELFSVSFTTVLHSGAGVDVRAEIESWKNLVTKVNYLYLNGKRFGPALQLRKVSVSNVKLDDFGRMRLATLSFELKEYDASTSSVKADVSSLDTKPSTEEKKQTKKTNARVKNAKKQSIDIGSYVKPVGSKYTTGQAIPEWVKERSHKVSAIDKAQNTVLLGSPDGINSWVYLDEVTLV